MKRVNEGAVSLVERCLACGADIVGSEVYLTYRVCPVCRFHYSITARERMELLADKGKFKERYRTITSLDPLSFKERVSYKERVFRDQRRTGLSEAAVVGICSIGGIKTVLLILDFGFLGGSMGCVVGEKVALAFELAVKKKLPLVAIVASGGIRLQEGVLSLMQMAKTATSATRLHKSGLPYICVMANPTTGQAYASFASLADILIGEPGALVGLAPVRLVQDMADKPVPLSSHTTQAHLGRGMLDMVVDREQSKECLQTLLNLLLPGKQKLKPVRSGKKKPHKSEAWEAVQLARHPDRPKASDYIKGVFSDFVELQGDRIHRNDPGIVCGPASLSGLGVMVIAQEREGSSHKRSYTGVSPEGLRKAQRVMRLAAKFHMPIITLLDTPGASLSLEAEEGGIGNALATSMALMSELPVPIISVVIGEGGSEGALALGVADRILMMENAIYSPISPETASAFLYRNSAKAEEMAKSLRLTAVDCEKLGIVDQIVPEPDGGAHLDANSAYQLLKRAVINSLAQLQRASSEKLVKERYEKFRKMGEYSSYFRAAVAREVDLLKGYVAKKVKRIKAGRAQRKARQPVEPLKEEAALSDKAQVEFPPTASP